MVVLILFQLIHSDFVNIAGMINDVHAMPHTLGNRVASASM